MNTARSNEKAMSSLSTKQPERSVASPPFINDGGLYAPQFAQRVPGGRRETRRVPDSRRPVVRV